MKATLYALIVLVAVAAFVEGLRFDPPCERTGGHLAFVFSHGAATAVCEYAPGVLTGTAPVEVRR